MTINFELLKVREITSLKIYIFLVIDKIETSNLDSMSPHSKGFIEYSASGGSDVFT